MTFNIAINRAKKQYAMFCFSVMFAMLAFVGSHAFATEPKDEQGAREVPEIDGYLEKEVSRYQEKCTLLLQLGDFAKAAELNQKMIELFKEKKHPQYIIDDAEFLSKELLFIRGLNPDVQSQCAAACVYGQLAESSQYRDQLVYGELYAQKSAKMVEKAIGKDHLIYLQALHLVGVIQFDRGKLGTTEK